MSKHARSDDRDRIDELASYWVVLASERELIAEEQRELDAWRRTDPRHELAWQNFERTWSEIGQMNTLADFVSSPIPELPADKLKTDHKRNYTPPATWGAVAAVVLAMLTIPFLLWSEPSTEHTTQIAETRLITLPDGSQVTLAPASSLDVRFENGQRHVALTGGEAFFEVIHDPSRPFTVKAGKSLVRVVGTKFDVNYSSDSLQVAVMQGEVEVTGPTDRRARFSTTRLTAGQRTEILLGAADPAHNGTVIAAPAPGAWREGRLVYDNVRLADLVADLNRYYEPGVSIEDPAIAGLRITAAFKVSEIPKFVTALDDVIAVETHRDAQGAFRLQSTPL